MSRPKIGLALGSGAAKGLAHIGVLKVLEEYNIPIDFISGTSMGALIGALYSAEPDAKKLEKDALKTKWIKLMDLTIPKYGLLKGKKTEKALRDKLQNKKFKDLKIPLFVIAADIEANQKIIFQKGDVAKAVRASISIPGVFIPVKNKRRTLVDGGIMDPLPVEILKKAGAEIIIAVNVISIEEKKSILNEEASIKKNNKKNPNILNILLKSFQIIEAEESKAILEKTKVDLIITPNLKSVSLVDFFKVREAIKAGEDSTRDSLKDIKRSAKRNFLKVF